jgi:NHL repeat
MEIPSSPPKSKSVNFKSVIYAAFQLFGGWVCAGTLLLFPSNMQAQNLFVANEDANSITEITPDGVQSTFASGVGTVGGLAFNNVGNLFQANSSGMSGRNVGGINEFTPSGAETTFAFGLNFPTGLAFNSAGNLFVANTSGNTIYYYTPSGIRHNVAAGFNIPTGLAFDTAGNLYVADYGSGSIYEFTTGGTINTFATGLTTPYGLAFQNEPLPVPEPSDLSLLAVSVTALLLRRQSKKRFLIFRPIPSR